MRRLGRKNEAFRVFKNEILGFWTQIMLDQGKRIKIQLLCETLCSL